MLNYTASPTGQDFLDSKKFLKLICGPVGGGKSTVGLFDLIQRAFTQAPFDGVRRTKFGIVRNTSQQLRSTIKPLIDTWLVTMPKGRLGHWRITEGVFEMRCRLPDGTTVFSEFMLLPVDTPDDVRRLLSLELSAAWCEEAREIAPEVFDALQGRVNRFPSKVTGGVSYAGVICSTNPPPAGGFWHKNMTAPEANMGVFMQPPALLDDDTLNPNAENLENLADDYYDNLITGKTEDWINVYLKNKYGAGDMGQPVYRGSFKRSFHVAKQPLIAVAQGFHPLIVGMDNGLTAAAVVGQQDARGRVNVLAEAYVPDGETMGVERFLDTLLIPVLRARFPQFRQDNIVFVLDPACFTRSQVNEDTIAQAVSKRGYKTVKPLTNDPERRISAVETLLTRQIDGSAGYLIDPSCTHFINTMEWGFRYKKSKSGVPTNEVEKNHWSHIGDAGQYMALHYNMESAGGLAQPTARPVKRSTYSYI